MSGAIVENSSNVISTIASGLAASDLLDLRVERRVTVVVRSLGDDRAAGCLEDVLDDTVQAGAVGVVLVDDARCSRGRPRRSGCRAPRPGAGRSERCASRGRCRPTSVKSGDVLAGEKVMMPSATLLSRKSFVTPDDAAPMHARRRLRSADAGSWSRNALLSVSPESPKTTSSVSRGAGVVDLVEGEADAGLFGRAEEGEAAGLGKDGADA